MFLGVRMITNFFSVRVNLAIVLCGALAIIFGIKVTPLLLPAQFYFSFSKLVGAEPEPFMVDPPGVAAAKLCDLLEAKSIPPDVFSRQINCNADDLPRADKRKHAEEYTKDQIDKIYSIALQSDLTLRKMLEVGRTQAQIKLIQPAQLDKIMDSSHNVRLAFEGVFHFYSNQLRQEAQQTIGETVETLYADFLPSEDPPSSSLPPSEALYARLSSEDRNRIALAHNRFVQTLASASTTAADPIKKSAIDHLLNRSIHQDLGRGIVDYYEESMVRRLNSALKAAFSAEGAAVPDEEAQKRIALTEVLRASYWNYIIAIVVRLLPVVLIAVILGLIFGRREMTSVSVAGGLAAFLLSWPLMLLWDRLVQTSWVEKRPLFLAFYAVYIVSFYVTARASALVGSRLREGMGLGLGAPHDAASEIASLSWKEVTVNITGAVLLNGMLYAWNAIIPFSNVASR